MNSAVATHGNDLVVVMDPRLSRQIDGMTGVNGPGPLNPFVLFGDRAQVARDTPGIPHICHRVQDDFHFALHNEFSMKMSP
jgi:hypothetical protein